MRDSSMSDSKESSAPNASVRTHAALVQMSIVNCTRCGAGVFTGERLTELPRVGLDSIIAIDQLVREHQRRVGSIIDEIISTELRNLSAALRRSAGLSQ
jgi:hypothetical protein